MLSAAPEESDDAAEEIRQAVAKAREVVARLNPRTPVDVFVAATQAILAVEEMSPIASLAAADTIGADLEVPTSKVVEYLEHYYAEQERTQEEQVLRRLRQDLRQVESLPDAQGRTEETRLCLARAVASMNDLRDRYAAKRLGLIDLLRHRALSLLAGDAR